MQRHCRRFHPWPARLFDHIERSSAHNNDDGLHVNGEPTCRAKPLFRTHRLTTGLPEVVLGVPVNEKLHGGDPDPLPGTVFVLIVKTPTGTDDDVIDICTFRRNDHASFDAPALVHG